MKYLTPEIFQSSILYTPLEWLKKNFITEPRCDDYWKDTYGGPACNANISWYVQRYYGGYWDSTRRIRTKIKYIYIKAYCEVHKPKRCRKLTQKEMFYIQVC